MSAHAKVLHARAGPKTPRTKGVDVSIAAASQTNGSPEERIKLLVAPLEGEVGISAAARWHPLLTYIAHPGQAGSPFKHLSCLAYTLGHLRRKR